MTDHRRAWQLSADRLRAYSRGGNFHSDPAEAQRLGLPGLVAQGMQVAGPAYGLLLDRWGEDFLAHGELELTFVGMVVEDETVEAQVTAVGDTAELTVTTAGGAIAAFGRARRASAEDR